MKNPFLRIFKSQSKKLPDKVSGALNKHFPDAKNIDWENKEKDYEAIFYLNEVEHIARFTSKGLLKEYKKNLWPAELPEIITTECKKMGEIMNAIAIYRNQEQFFEVIVRDAELNRTLLLFNASAGLLNQQRI